MKTNRTTVKPYRFVVSMSGRCYVQHGDQLYFYAMETRDWQRTHDTTLTALLAHPRCKEVGTEDDFPHFVRRSFRERFGWDSNLKSKQIEA